MGNLHFVCSWREIRRKWPSRGRLCSHHRAPEIQPVTKKPHLARLLALTAGAALLLQACGGSSDPPDNPMLPPGNVGVAAVLVSSPSAVVNGPPGAYYISEDRKEFHLRCPGGSCTKSTILPLAPATGAFVWTLSGEPGKPTLSPSIHWFESNGVQTHWHGWLRNGYFQD
jgi:hypothetical protein